jgi:OmpA-OmpF porin, OOP family
MTDLPADPRAWDDERTRPGATRVHDASATDAQVQTAGPPLPVRVLGDADADAAATAAAPAEETVGPLASPSVSYETLRALAPRPSARSLIGPFVGVALLALGLGFLLARTAGSGGTPTSRTVVTPPPSPTVLGTQVRATSTVAATTSAAPATTASAATTIGAASTTAGTKASTTASTAASTTASPTIAVVTATTIAVVTAAAPGTVSGVDVVAPVRWAEFSGGRVYLHGRVPNASVAATIVRKAAAVVGDGNVEQDYVVDPSTPDVAGGPLTVADTVQFDANSDVARPEFGRILELGVLLMKQNPAVRITVVGRSDSRGPASYNMELSIRRAGAVVAYIAGRGIDRRRPARYGRDRRRTAGEPQRRVRDPRPAGVATSNTCPAPSPAQ